MAYSDPSLKATKGIVLFTEWNEFVNNFKATFVGQAAAVGDTPYATGALVVAILSIGNAGDLYRSTGTAPEWADPTDGAKLDGDRIDIDFTPSNYTPDDSPSEAADVDDLAAHLAGIDNAIGGEGAKGWCSVTFGGLLSAPSFNISSVTNNGTGDSTIIWDTDFLTAIYSVGEAADHPLVNNECGLCKVGQPAAGTVRVRTTSSTSFDDLIDMQFSVAAWGNQ